MLALGYLVLLTLALRCAAAPPEKDWCSKPDREQKIEPQGTLDDETYPHGKVVTFLCRPGYSHLGTIKMVCVEGKWIRISDGKCQKQSCGHPGDIEFGSFTLIEGDGFVFGATVQYSCDEGYQMVSKQTTRECTESGWSHQTPSCEGRTCSVTRSDLIQFLPFKKVFKFNEVVESLCLEGYTLKGAKTSRCSFNGWEPALPTCEATSCPPPPSIDNGRLLPKLKAEYASGEKVQYTCNKGYNLQKTGNEATCEETKWKSVPVCRRTGASCSTPPTVQFGDHLGPNQPNYRSGFQIKYKCPSYFKLVGKETVTCEDGVWDEPPVCLEPCTVKENDMRKNNIVLRWVDANKLYTEHDQPTEFICIEGYEIADGSLLRGKCNKGVILYPKCSSFGSCLLSEETMKQQNIYLNRNTAIQNGEKVLFECNKGMVPENTLEGTCKMRILNYPKCIISQKCKSLPDVLNGRIKSEELKEDGYDSGSSVEFECDENHKLSGPINVKCETGQWSDLPQCLKPCRISLEELSTNNVALKSQADANKVFKDSEIVFVKCKTGYRNPTLGIDAKGECYNGKMRYSRCFQKSFCRIDQDNIDGNNLELDAIHNDEGYYVDEEDVHFICKKGFRSMTGSLTGKCQKTILTYPRCIPEQEISV